MKIKFAGAVCKNGSLDNISNPLLYQASNWLYHCSRIPWCPPFIILISFCLVWQVEWEDIFSKVSLDLVAMKRSYFGSAIFLCRRPAPAKEAIYFPVDEAHYKWVEPLKVRNFSMGIHGLSFLFQAFHVDVDCSGESVVLIQSYPLGRCHNSRVVI